MFFLRMNCQILSALLLSFDELETKLRRAGEENEKLMVAVVSGAAGG